MNLWIIFLVVFTILIVANLIILGFLFYENIPKKKGYDCDINTSQCIISTNKKPQFNNRKDCDENCGKQKVFQCLEVR